MRQLETYAVLGASLHGAAVLAVQALASGMSVGSLTGTLTHRPDPYTIQIDAQTHLLPDGQLWCYLNHSCTPNCRIDFSTWTLVTTRAIQCHEELTFNYLTTEWTMTAPFMCQCGALNCYGYVAGFDALTPAQQVILAPRCSPLVRRLWRAQATAIPRVPLAGWQPEVHVLIPYSMTDDRLESPSHDTPAYRAEVQSWFETLQLPWRWVPVTLAGLTQTLATICAPGQTGPALVCNLCDGDEVHGYPGPSVVRALEQARLPFTGAAATFYALSTSKIAMKKRLRQRKIATPPFVCLDHRLDAMARLTTHVGYPAMIKPAVSAASTGISLRSCVHDVASARAQFTRLVQSENGARFLASGIFAERFVDGPEFTVLVVADQRCARGVRAYPAVERVFHSALPPHERFLSYDRYWAYYQEETRLPDTEPFYRYALAVPALQAPLCDLAVRAFLALSGTGYARVDIRMEARTGVLYVLEVNANCGLSGDAETSVGQILRLTGVPMHQLLASILEAALVRFQALGPAQGYDA
jgi:D-alanine-D-alanine ligase